MTDTDLFGGSLPPPPSVRQAPLHDIVLWSRIAQIKKPRCGHCTMLAHGGEEVSILTAGWTRVGKDGSVLDLCEGHKLHQQIRDDRMGSTDEAAEGYFLLRDAIIDTMEDPNSWDKDASEVSILIDYVQWLSLKIHDINTILDRDVA